MMRLMHIGHQEITIVLGSLNSIPYSFMLARPQIPLRTHALYPFMRPLASYSMILRCAHILGFTPILSLTNLNSMALTSSD
jgi:hypothetical protein